MRRTSLVLLCLTQPQIPPGKTFVYEFEARRSGTFMYHPHADEMVQIAMGMMGLWITHPREPKRTPGYSEVDRDFCFLLNAFDIEPGSATLKVMTVLDFNLWRWNSRVFPDIDILPVRLADRVRIRVGNLTMTNHPVRLHGHEFVVAGTDGGWSNPAARWPEITADIAVGQMRALEMGGMFSVPKVRAGLGADDHRDPGWYSHPPGSVAYEWTGESVNPRRAPASNSDGSEVQHHVGTPWRAVKPKGSHRH
jgi:FtsP/CotA-like multicopper oxidase with cupredoxin domain